MKRFFLLTLFYFTTISTASAGEPPRSYLNANFGLGNFKSPLIYNYSLNYTIDLNISKRSSITLGLEWENYFQHVEYPVDTNFINGPNTTGAPTPQYYFINYKTMTLEPSLGYKYWLKKSKSKALYLEAKIYIVVDIVKVAKYEYYYRDFNQTLQLGPYSWTNKETHGRYIWGPDNIKPCLTFGYLKNINEHFAWHFKFDLIIAVPDQNPRDLALLYPKLGIGLVFL